jgi:hypothetical protein
MERQGRTLAKSEKVRRRVKFSETCPFPIGVAKGPFKAIVFFLTDTVSEARTKGRWERNLKRLRHLG